MWVKHLGPITNIQLDLLDMKYRRELKRAANGSSTSVAAWSAASTSSDKDAAHAVDNKKEDTKSEPKAETPVQEQSKEDTKSEPKAETPVQEPKVEPKPEVKTETPIKESKVETKVEPPAEESKPKPQSKKQKQLEKAEAEAPVEPAGAEIIHQPPVEAAMSTPVSLVEDPNEIVHLDLSSGFVDKSFDLNDFMNRIQRQPPDLGPDGVHHNPYLEQQAAINMQQQPAMNQQQQVPVVEQNFGPIDIQAEPYVKPEKEKPGIIQDIRPSQEKAVPFENKFRKENAEMIKKYNYLGTVQAVAEQCEMHVRFYTSDVKGLIACETYVNGSMRINKYKCFLIDTGYVFDGRAKVFLQRPDQPLDLENAPAYALFINNNGGNKNGKIDEDLLRKIFTGGHDMVIGEKKDLFSPEYRKLNEYVVLASLGSKAKNAEERKPARDMLFKMMRGGYFSFIKESVGFDVRFQVTQVCPEIVLESEGVPMKYGYPATNQVPCKVTVGYDGKAVISCPRLK